MPRTPPRNPTNDRVVAHRLRRACSVEHAFTTWTEKIDTWWPADHTPTGAPDVVVVLETAQGGRIYERTPTGARVGEVILWEPPTRLGYVWHLRRDRADATEVEIRFVDLGGGVTRIEIEHRGWGPLGSGGQDCRDRNRAGWNMLLPHYRAAVKANYL